MIKPKNVRSSDKSLLAMTLKSLYLPSKYGSSASHKIETISDMMFDQDEHLPRKLFVCTLYLLHEATGDEITIQALVSALKSRTVADNTHFIKETLMKQGDKLSNEATEAVKNYLELPPNQQEMATALAIIEINKYI